MWMCVRTHTQMGCDETYVVLNVLEFTSTRKRMGVVVRCADGTLELYVNGRTCTRSRPPRTHSLRRTVLKTVADEACDGEKQRTIIERCASRKA